MGRLYHAEVVQRSIVAHKASIISKAEVIIGFVAILLSSNSFCHKLGFKSTSLWYIRGGQVFRLKLIVWDYLKSGVKYNFKDAWQQQLLLHWL